MATVTSFLFYMFVWTTLTTDTSSFILDNQNCFVLPPCTCSTTEVRCASKQLTTFPIFKVANITGNPLQFDLQNNQLTMIPSHSFRNLTVSNNTDVYIYLNNNYLNSIAANAFAGIADRILYFQLDNNNLSTLPSELQTLSRLNILFIKSNPIVALSPNTMQWLGGSLRTLVIDLNHFKAWPTELNLLTSLTDLTVRYLNMTHLDFDVFHGFENKLQILYIQYSLLERVPAAVCRLHNLLNFKFSNNDNLNTNHSFFETCNRNLTSVRVVNLDNNNLKYIPNVFKTFPSMTYLNANYNRFRFIHWDIIPTDAPLRSLSLESNDLTRISSAINKLRALNDLYLDVNAIRSIEDSDLSNLTELHSLYIGRNPLEYISPHAFDNNPALSELGLDNTYLRQLPSSIAALPNLGTLYLRGTPIECNCDMSVLKPWNVTGITIYGNCKSASLPIKTFLTGHLPHCF